MALLVKRDGNLPSLVNDFFDTDRFFGRDFLDFDRQFRRMNASLPSVNIIENNKDFRIELAAPGLDKKDFKVEVEDGILTVSAEKKIENEEKENNYHRKEFSYTSFSRSFRLPENLASDKIDAKYENGVLKLSLPKKEVAEAKPKKQISVS